MRANKILPPFLVTLLLNSSISLAIAKEEKTLIFGIVPQQAASKTVEMWTPLLKQLSKKTGYTIHFATAKDIPTFEKKLAAGEYDLAYMNPYHYTVFHEKLGYKAIAKESDTRLKTIIVTRNDASYQKLHDLSGMTLAFPAPASFAATVLPLLNFAKLGIEVKPKYVTSHSSVYLAVSQGLFPAGGGVMRTFEAMPDDVKSQLRIMWTSEGYTPHAIAAHPRLSKGAVNKISNALLALNNDEEGKAALSAINFKGVAAAKNKDWDDIRTLNIKNLDHLLQE